MIPMSLRSEIKTIFYTCGRCHKKHYGHQRKFDKHVEYAELSRVLTQLELKQSEL